LLSSPAPGIVLRVPGSSDLLAIWNSCCINTQRLSLSSAISTDGGLTWKWKRDIEAVPPGNARSVQYPALTFIDGFAYLTYRATALSLMQEYVTVLPTAWFYAERDNIPPASVGR
jgi:hypothetical protein